MKIEPSATDWAFAKSVRDEFLQKPGSQHIASEFALAYLSAVLNEVKPRSVLEFGAGIGTITSFLMKHPTNIDHVTTTESNAFCLEQFAANIPEEYRGRYDLIADDSNLIPGHRRYELVIVDHSVGKQGCAFLDPGMICFVEGGRTRTRQEIQGELAGRGLRCNLANYNRGMRYFSMGLRRTKKTGIPYPKVHIAKARKGCWIGVVEPTV